MPILLVLGVVTAAPAMAEVVNGGNLTSGTAVTGTIPVANRDIQYGFAATSGGHVTFDVTASSWGSGTAKLNVFNPTGGLYYTCTLTATPSFCDFTPNVAGAWKVILDPVSAAIGSATFTFANDQAKGALTASTPISTSIALKGQNATYSFAATAGVHTAFDVSASSWNTAARLYFHNPAGAAVTYCVLGSAPSLCELTPNVTGTWKVVLDPQLAAVGSATFSYAPDQIKGPLTSGTPITTSITGKGVNATYTFAGAAGKHVAFDVTAASWGTGSANLYFFRPSGGLYFNCPVTAGAGCDFTPDTTGAWKVTLDPVASSLGSTTFTFADDQVKGALTVGTPITTSITTRGQKAGYTFAGTNGAHEVLNVTASNWGGGEANLSIVRPDGELFTYCVLGTGPTFCDFTPNVTGTWRIELDPQGSATGSTTFALVHDQAKGVLTHNVAIGTSIAIKGQNANYTFAGTDGTPVTFQVSAANWGGGAATLNFYQPNGDMLDYCILTSGPVTCDITPNVTGTWKVVLDPYEDAVGSTTFKFLQN